METGNTTKEGEKKKNCQPIILYPVKLSFKTKSETKMFSHKQALRLFNGVRSSLPETPCPSIFQVLTPMYRKKRKALDITNIWVI